MRDFKKAIFSTLTVVLLAGLLSVLIVSVNPKNPDARVRDELAGKIDCVIVGASQAQFAFDTRELDNGLGCSSYNLSYDAYSTREKEYVLQEELGRNHIDTVIVELSYDTMKRGDVIEFTKANAFTILRMGSLWDRMEYFVKYVNLENKLLVGSQWMYESLKEKFLGTVPLDPMTIDLKGTRLMTTVDHSIPDAEVADAYNKDSFSFDEYNQDTINKMADLIAYCKENCANVYVVVVPVSDHFIWSTDDLDLFEDWARTYCDDLGVPFFDFNLLRSRYTLFNDKDCYSTDYHHMSGKGAKIFSQEFARLIKLYRSGSDITDYFYPSYEEAKKDSPYWRAYSETAP